MHLPYGRDILLALGTDTDHDQIVAAQHLLCNATYYIFKTKIINQIVSV
jgi:hypothetical protein